jgi:hypothetical protein
MINSLCNFVLYSLFVTTLPHCVTFCPISIVSLLSVFWKNKRRLMNSPCCLCRCIPAQFLKAGIMDPDEMAVVERVVLYAIPVIWKASRQLVLPRTSCSIVRMSVPFPKSIISHETYQPKFYIHFSFFQLLIKSMFKYSEWRSCGNLPHSNPQLHLTTPTPAVTQTAQTPFLQSTRQFLLFSSNCLHAKHAQFIHHRHSASSTSTSQPALTSAKLRPAELV